MTPDLITNWPSFLKEQGLPKTGLVLMAEGSGGLTRQELKQVSGVLSANQAQLIGLMAQDALIEFTQCIGLTISRFPLAPYYVKECIISVFSAYV